MNEPAGRLGDAPDRRSPNEAYGADDAERLWREAFGSAADAQVIASEADAIFRMSPRDGSSAILLRIADDRDGSLGLQADLLAHVERAAPDLPVPRMRRNHAGALCTMLPSPEGARHVAIAMSFLPGKPLAALPDATAHRERIFEHLALLDAALADFRHPAAERDLLWDVSRADQVLPMIGAIPDPELRRLAQAAILDWQADIAPRIGALRRQVLHNDFNPSNILVDDRGAISGIIDFGDVLSAPLICDVATAAAYQAPDIGFAAMLASAACAYRKHVPLTSQELALLPGLVRARAAMIAAIAHWRSARTPTNCAYLLRNVPAAARLLLAAARDSENDDIEEAP